MFLRLKCKRLFELTISSAFLLAENSKNGTSKMKKRQLKFDHLETRTALCAAFGSFVGLTGSVGGTGLPQDGRANANASEVGGYKSGGYETAGFGSVGEAVQFQLKEVGGVCNRTA